MSIPVPVHRRVNRDPAAALVGTDGPLEVGASHHSQLGLDLSAPHLQANSESVGPRAVGVWVPLGSGDPHRNPTRRP
jgi:hypothetical protein